MQGLCCFYCVVVVYPYMRSVLLDGLAHEGGWVQEVQGGQAGWVLQGGRVLQVQGRPAVWTTGHAHLDAVILHLENKKLNFTFILLGKQPSINPFLVLGLLQGREALSFLKL